MTASAHTGPDPQGSRWRRWDPHVHLPGTLQNNQFGNMTVAEALDTLRASEPAIEVVGVTDYFTTASYRRANDAWRGGAGAGIKMLFPNVELRLTIPTARGSGVNAHLLCAPDQVDELEQFIALLEFRYDGRAYRCNHEDLTRLGRAWKRNGSLDDEAALRAGASQFKVDFADLRKRFGESDWARHHCLVAIAVGQGDGTSGLRTDDGAFGALRAEMERFAHIIFSGSPRQVEFWLGRGSLGPSELTENYGGKKPCVHGSDAHRADQLGAPQHDRFTWLKGDASLDTLRLACLAPDSRCHIGSAPPTSGTGHGRIRNLTVTPTGWFEPGRVPINSGLVAVIGARGSGKTALVDLLVAGAGSRDPFDNEKSFVERVGPLLDDVVACVEWSHGESTQCAFRNQPTPDGSARVVRYLSQQFVERLCTARGVSDELVAEIERVVFNAWPVEDRQGATDRTPLIGPSATGAVVGWFVSTGLRTRRV